MAFAGALVHDADSVAIDLVIEIASPEPAVTVFAEEMLAADDAARLPSLYLVVTIPDDEQGAVNVHIRPLGAGNVRELFDLNAALNVADLTR